VPALTCALRPAVTQLLVRCSPSAPHCVDRSNWRVDHFRHLIQTCGYGYSGAMSRVLKWNGQYIPEELSLPAARYVVEAVDDAPALTAEDVRRVHRERQSKGCGQPRRPSVHTCGSTGGWGILMAQSNRLHTGELVRSWPVPPLRFYYERVPKELRVLRICKRCKGRSGISRWNRRLDDRMLLSGLDPNLRRDLPWPEQPWG